MSKAFTREGDDDIEDDVEEASPLPAGARNYMTPGGFA
ncbi:MAG TPA: transcription elongation factor GreB, partial [Casimicrobiaceae bacterium]|nr:transcription elongation factor GreB [Casimicrobiaceae bacterium]